MEIRNVCYNTFLGLDLCQIKEFIRERKERKRKARRGKRGARRKHEGGRWCPCLLPTTCTVYWWARQCHFLHPVDNHIWANRVLSCACVAKPCLCLLLSLLEACAKVCRFFQKAFPLLFCLIPVNSLLYNKGQLSHKGLASQLLP